MPPAALAKSALFERLAAGHAAGITVVTPNRRLAQVLRAEFDVFQVDSGKTVWEDADILPLDAFVARMYEEATYSESAASGGEPLPMLLSDAQSRALWEEAIRGSRWHGALLDVPQTAASALDAWRLAQAWNIAGAAFSEPGKFAAGDDTRAFADWARAYAQRLKKDGLIDAALLGSFEFKIKKPKLLVAYAFDVVPAQARDLFARFEFSSCHPEKKQGHSAKTSFASPKEELETAARWARARLEEGKKRIGVVVPDVQLRRREVVRTFTRVMGVTAPFNLSIGEPLADYPVVAFALGLFDFSFSEKPYEQVSRLIRSPFFGGADTEMAARARFDARLREEADATLSLPKLIGMMEGLALRSHLEKIFQLKPEKQSPHDWAQHFTALLAAAGFPGERAPDSAEFQTIAKFNEVLGEFSRLSLVASNFSFQKAIHELKGLCKDTLFQPEGAAGETRAPVQVLGLLESAGIGFDALWVSGLTDSAWPLRSHPNPFLPVQLQRKAGIPEASAEEALALDRRITEGWLAAADEVVLSWPRREEDRDLLPSPLIAEIAEKAVDVPPVVSYRELIFSKGKTETFTDETAPPLQGTTVKGGTRILSDQAACPFRAFAHHRLRAEELESPAPGLNALERGNLVHALMAGIWKQLGSSSSLSLDLEPVIAKAATAAVAELKLEGRFAALEVERLKKLARDWLALEKTRAPFEVVAIERDQAIKISKIEFKGKIDRMDRLADGSYALIDYKTGAQLTPRQWMGDRPDEPQLPLYAVSATEDVSAVAFAKLRAGQMRYMGYARAKDAIPKLMHYPTWGSLLAEWQASLGGLAQGFADGDARVDPKKGLTTCRNCDLQTLCRVHERLRAEEEGGEDE